MNEFNIPEADRVLGRLVPEALRLADMIERYNAGVMSQKIAEDYIEAAAELRRLHAENERISFMLRECEERVFEKI